MEDITTPRCPVCGTSAKKAEKGIKSCPVCDYMYAFIQYFADERDVLAWMDKAKKHREKIVERICKKQFLQSALYLGDRALAVIASEKQFLFCSSNNEKETLTNVKQISFGGRHCLLCFEDGHVETRLTSGRRAEQGQCRVEDWSNITFVEAGVNCSYGVRTDGSVLVSGIPPVPSEKIISLRNMKAISEGDTFVACLTNAGKLMVIIPEGASQELKSMQKSAEICQNIISIEATKGCVITLDKNKEVHCFCVEKNDPRLSAEAWSDVEVIAVDSHYAVGLTTKGKIRLAGQQTIMDAGRKDAVTWENNVALACAPSGIGAIALDGTLHIAGNVLGLEALQQVYNPYAQDIAAAIIH